ncbi:MAG TPA: hypothetical protein VNK24_08075 [Elusimicrobiota bacterium]|nr:hypothetical protein [Elusimicrobiota bacterium]
MRLTKLLSLRFITAACAGLGEIERWRRATTVLQQLVAEIGRA